MDSIVSRLLQSLETDSHSITPPDNPSLTGIYIPQNVQLPPPGSWTPCGSSDSPGAGKTTDFRDHTTG
jgi:hypothetical protein